MRRIGACAALDLKIGEQRPQCGQFPPNRAVPSALRPEVIPPSSYVKLSCSAERRACPFLGEDDCCTIYGVRPAICREYPRMDKEGVVFRTMGVAHNTLICPAVFWVVEPMNWWTLG
jgi:Fe-S-cluster containining protein